jgi:PIN domain nuclease of toxin-antitoxin system
MRGYLLDTQAFLWWTSDPERLPGRLFTILNEPESKLLLSVASCWEMQIKIGIGKLVLAEGMERLVEREIEVNALEILPIGFTHTSELRNLPPLHKDPFDRMLIAQAKVESLALVSGDEIIKRYPDIVLLWD